MKKEKKQLNKQVDKQSNKQSVKKRIIEISNKIRIKKEGENNVNNFNYFKPDDIMIILNPLLKEYNLITIFQMEFNVEKDMYGGVLIIDDCDEDKSVIYYFDIPLTIMERMSQAQNAGATMTYCKRYMLMNAFNIADNNLDPDKGTGRPVSKSVNKSVNRPVSKSVNRLIEENNIVQFEKVKKIIGQIKDTNSLIEYSKNLPTSKLFNEKQKKELQELISSQVDNLNN